MHITQRRVWCVALALSSLSALSCGDIEGDDADEEGELGAEAEEQALLSRGPGWTVIPRRSLSTSESGERSVVWLALRSPPRRQVNVALTINEPGEAEVSPAELRFGVFDWWLPRRVTVTGVADLVADGDAAYKLTITARSADPRYAALDPLVLTGINREGSAFHGLASVDQVTLMTSVADLSLAGDVAVGSVGSGTDERAARWSVATQLQLLAGVGVAARGVSSDGARIVGSLLDARYHGGRAAVRWDSPEAELTRFQAPPVPPYAHDFGFYSANAITNDGRTFGECVQAGTPGPTLGCRTPDTMGGLLRPASVVPRISPDGSHWVGTEIPTRYGPPVQYAVADYRELPYPEELGCSFPRPCDATGEDVSDGGEVVVGSVMLAPRGAEPPAPYERHAFMYAAGWTRLPDLPGGPQDSVARAVSSDGSIIAGHGSDSAGQQAVLWRNGEPRAVAALLEEAGTPPPRGWQLREVVALSGDGRTLVGNGINPAGAPQAFRVVLPR